MPSQPPRVLLDSLFRAALGAVDPLVRTPLFLPSPPRGRTVVAAFGKAAAAMARAAEDHWDGPLSGLAVTRYGHGLACRRIEVVEASHPNPDAAAVEAATRMLALAGELGEDDLLLTLVSGGGSALLTLPAPGLTLEDKRAVTKALLASGAPIGEINTVRRHLSAIKGGRLALAASPAAVETLVISDVPGDDPSQVASGPTVPDRSTPRDALDVMDRWNIDVSPRVRDYLRSARSPVAGDPAFAHVRAPRVIANAQDALNAAAAACPSGVTPVLLSSALEGEAGSVARAQAEMARVIIAAGLPARPPALILSGGETTVVVRNPKGRGGRNTEYLLALAIALDGHPAVHAQACDTDGIDGTEDNAGAVIGPDTLARARGLGLDPSAMLAANEAYAFFERLGDLVKTGPTRTNVNDFRAVLVSPP